tara:strand:- start:14893 stop:17439 length:2547 start_codon:yes stop_codon:yes gene_type:complete
MVFQKYIIILITLVCFSIGYGQKLGFSERLMADSEGRMPFAIPNSEENSNYLNREGVTVKRKTENWIFITATPEFIASSVKDQEISDYYFEYCPPTLLDDTARAMHNVDQVHNGQSPLLQSYTGKDVIVGIVDEGLDHRHPDFIKPNGDSRVIRYWDHSITNPTQTPAPYNYGQVWYASQINDGTITSNEETSGHGTTVTGIATGNGLANGTNKGMAPESDIIFVETNFNFSNWTLSIADACDFIFRVADSLGKPAIVNLSLGTYLGSHDGNDPASEFMESLLDQKEGRLIVCAAGNSGNQAPYHAQANMNSVDTNFVWFENNPSGAFGNNTVFFDLWTDQVDATFEYAFGANLPGPTFQDRASTIFRNATDQMGTSPLHDTLWSENGDRIATIQIYREYVGDNYHMQALCTRLDSTNYRFRFSTTGSGNYDLWSGQFLGLNKIVNNIPTPTDFPSISNYVLPDSLQSIVSSWNCSEKVVSVGNLRCRLGHIDNNGNQYYPATDMTTPGKIAPSSSRGPARSGVLKPDISASGDVTVASGPFWIINNPAYNASIDSGGWHVRNGGTSMASPTVAGIAALYFERCGNSSWLDFKNDLQLTAMEDMFTGQVPNFEYGAGKVDAFELLKETSGNLQLLGDSIICQVPIEINTNLSLQNYEWSSGENTSSVTIDEADTVFVWGNDEQGCLIYSDTLTISVGNPLPNPSISQLDESLISSSGPSYQWYLNDSPIPGENSQVIYPDSVGFYSVSITGPDGCESFSNAFEWTLGIENEISSDLSIYPNPSTGKFSVSSSELIGQVSILDPLGQTIMNLDINKAEFAVDLSGLSVGTYFISLKLNDKRIVRKISIR